MEWIFSVQYIESGGCPVTRNFAVEDADSDEDARRTIIHNILAQGGHVCRIAEPMLPLEPLVHFSASRC